MLGAKKSPFLSSTLILPRSFLTRQNTVSARKQDFFSHLTNNLCFILFTFLTATQRSIILAETNFFHKFLLFPLKLVPSSANQPKKLEKSHYFEKSLLFVEAQKVGPPKKYFFYSKKSKWPPKILDFSNFFGING